MCSSDLKPRSHTEPNNYVFPHEDSSIGILVKDILQIEVTSKKEK